jgi:hypothetical protein
MEPTYEVTLRPRFASSIKRMIVKIDLEFPSNIYSYVARQFPGYEVLYILENPSTPKYGTLLRIVNQ